MKIIPITPKKALNKAFLKQKPMRCEIDLFKSNLVNLLNKVDEIEREENQKNHIRDFLRDTYYKDSNEINTKDTKDLVIHLGKTNKDKVGVIIEAKRPSNKNEMLSVEKPNVKAFHELVLYYLRERIEENNIDIKYCIATNIYEWYIIEASYFEKLFFRNKSFVKDYEQWRDGKKVTKDTNLFYNEIVKPFVDKLDDEIPCTYFDIRSYEKVLKNEDKEDDNNLIALFKILSSYHLLKTPYANDSNSLNEKFYKELLHIIGLEEAKEGSKNIIRRKKENRNSGSLLENTINAIETEDPLHRISDISMYGDNKPDHIYNVALELCITWINRILFLKLLEGQLVNYHKIPSSKEKSRDEADFHFLNSETIHDFDELFKLFHKVLAVNINDRTEAINDKYRNVPYLNSSLFEISELEDHAIKINSLDNSEQLELNNNTILKDLKKKNNKLTTLNYLFKFLDSYDFASEGATEIQEENKGIINASVLGKVFEKINGYKDGSIFTPGFITMYMCKQSIRLAVVQKFNEAKKWNIKHFDELYNKIDNRKEANEIINSLKICDPAVGSGHFLVSALNEIIAIKCELGVLMDENGKTLRDYVIEVVNDDLTISDENENFFAYNPKNKESNRVQKTLFHEKQTIIENCLFGVDINPNSVKICRLRLWIELLKSAYYKEETNYTELETIPNIDINIKCGNSLISRFALDIDLKRIAKSSKWTIFSYQNAVGAYKNSTDKEAKRVLENFITDIKANYIAAIQQNNSKLQKYYKLKNEFYNLYPENGLFINEPEADYGGSLKKQEEHKQKLKEEINKLHNELEDEKYFYSKNKAFEWRFEFPEVLNDNGDFMGFDLIIGNPPYIKEYENRKAFDGLRNKEFYQGKMDIWYLFGDLGLSLLKPNSYLNLIATNNWVTNAGASKFRNNVISKSKIVSLIDFGSYMIFENASIQTMIMLFKNNSATNNYTFDYRRLEGEKLKQENVLNLLTGIKTNSSILLSPTINKENLIDKTFTFNTDKNSGLLNKIKSKQNFYLREKADKKLKIKSELGQGIVAPQDFLNKASSEIANGIHHHHDIVNKDRKLILQNKYEVGTGIFVLSHSELESLKLSKQEMEIIKPNYTTKEISKYFTNPNNSTWVIYTKSDINKPDKKTGKAFIDNYPKIKQHLDNFKSVITSDFAPYGLHRAREQYFFEGEKIAVLRKCSKEPVFSYSDFDCYLSAAFYVIQTGRINLKYLTGLLNSKLIAFWLRKKGKMQGNNYQLDKEPLLEIPIFKPEDSEANKIATVVDQILNSKKQNKDSSELEKQIDTMAYNLYDLTDEEIKIVENC